MAKQSEEYQDKSSDQPKKSNMSRESAVLDKVVDALKDFGSILKSQELVQEQKSMVSDVTKAIRDTAERLASAQNPAKPLGKESCCGECVSHTCCGFEIVLDSVRATQPQSILELGDSGDTPDLPLIPGPVNPLEVQIFAAVDKVGVLVPSLWGTMQLRVGSTLLGGMPGPWTPIDRVIGKIYLPKGESREIQVTFDAAERDSGLERVLQQKDEFGTAAASLTLDCGCKKIYPAKPAVLRFNFGGSGGGQAGEIEIAFYARAVC